MSIPVVAIVGRPNVGKSTLFNKLTGKRISIVENTPGVTRDRIYNEDEWRGRKNMLVYTCGNEQKTDSEMEMDKLLQSKERQQEEHFRKLDCLIRQQQASRKESVKVSPILRLKKMFT